jgi:hypothetical protein
VPIVYEQPQPFDENVSQAAGRAESIIRLAPVMQRADEARAASFARQSEASQQAGQQNADRASKAAMFVYGQEADAFQQDAGRQQQAALANAQMQHQANLQGANAQAEENQQRLRFQAQMQLQQTELSHKEQVDLQRMKMAVGSIQSNSNLTDEEKLDLTTQLHTKIHPQEARAARAHIAREQAQTDALRQNSARAASIQQMDAQYFADGAQKSMAVLKDPQTGETIGYNVYKPGQGFDFVPVAKTPGAQAQVMMEERVRKVEDAAEKEWETAHKRALAQADKELAAVNAENTEAKAASKDQVVEVKRFDYAGRVAKLMEDFGAEKTLEAAKTKATRALRPAGPPGADIASRSRGDQPDETQKTFKREDPETQTLQQRAAVTTLKGQMASIRRAGLPQEVVAPAWYAADDALTLLEKYGSPEAMEAKAPADFAKYIDGVKKVDAALTLAKKKAAAPRPVPAVDATAPSGERGGGFRRIRDI